MDQMIIDQPRVSTRQLILDRAEQLIARDGVFGLQLKDIAQPLGIQVPAIYKHFKNRDAVLIGVGQRFIAQLAMQFEYPQELAPWDALRHALDEFARFKLENPAYVRLSLIDFATPQGGIEYVKLAAGGDFAENLNAGPLAAMHQRIRELLQSGVTSGDFREVDPVDFYRLAYGTVSMQLVFPDDSLMLSPSSDGLSKLQQSLWEHCQRFLKP